MTRRSTLVSVFIVCQKRECVKSVLRCETKRKPITWMGFVCQYGFSIDATEHSSNMGSWDSMARRNPRIFSLGIHCTHCMSDQAHQHHLDHQQKAT